MLTIIEENDDGDEWENYDDEEEDDDIFSDTDYLKYVTEGAATIAEVVERLETYASWLKRVSQAGFELQEPVDDAYLFFTHPEGKRLYEEREPGILSPTVE